MGDDYIKWISNLSKNDEKIAGLKLSSGLGWNRHGKFAKNIPSIRQMNVNQKLSDVTYGFTQYKKDLDIRQMKAGVPDTQGNFGGS